MFGQLHHQIVRIQFQPSEPLFQPAGKVRPSQQRLGEHIQEQPTLDLQGGEITQGRRDAGTFKLQALAGPVGDCEQGIGQMQRGAHRPAGQGFVAYRPA